MIPLFASSLEPYHDRLTEALERVARSGRYILGPEVEAFERDGAQALGSSPELGGRFGDEQARQVEEE